MEGCWRICNGIMLPFYCQYLIVILTTIIFKEKLKRVDTSKDQIDVGGVLFLGCTGRGECLYGLPGQWHCQPTGFRSFLKTNVRVLELTGEAPWCFTGLHSSRPVVNDSTFRKWSNYIERSTKCCSKQAETGLAEFCSQYWCWHRF